MKTTEEFISTTTKGYEQKGLGISLGTAIFDKKPQKNILITQPLKTLNRHGLVAGATGTGKTKTLQRLVESLSENSIPVLIMDMKGDVSGISQPGEMNPKIQERVDAIGVPWKPTAYPVEFLSISQEEGVKLRATVSEFGPILFSKILELNDTQASIISLIFKFADDNGLPLLDLKDLRKLIQFLTNEGKVEIEKIYGSISSASIGLILRKIVEIEAQGDDDFFGEPSFDVDDLMRVNDEGKGYINILRLMDIQDKPKMFSTFMLSLLSEVYATFPEEGDMDQPKLIIVIDEAHLIFKEATKTLLSQLETIMKLIRSKGVGILFCTQNPTDIPESILSQLGLKIQFALRAFTAQDRKTIKLVAQNYPETPFYNVEETLTSLGIGEALVTVLNEKGEPTPLTQTLMAPPQSRMDTISTEELSSIVRNSSLVKKYAVTVDPESAYELLSKRLEQASQAQKSTIATAGVAVGAGGVLGSLLDNKTAHSLLKSAMTSVVRNITGQITRDLLGAVLGKKSKRSLF